jgi:HSP20 family molecular chaperone IbpA
MHTIIHPNASLSRSRSARNSPHQEFRQPSYDCREQPDAVKLDVYVPGVDAADIGIEVRGSDLVVTARKPHLVRVNWQALHLESVQRDYRLRLRLGPNLDYAALHAELHNGVLTLSLPKRASAGGSTRMLNVA